MEEKKMIVGIVGMIIGVLILGAGIFYLVKEGKDAESRKIYLIITIVGAVVTAAMALKLIFSL